MSGDGKVTQKDILIAKGVIKKPGSKRKSCQKNEKQEKGNRLMAGKGLYANIHAKRKRGGKMRKKGAKGAPTAANFRRAKQTARS